MDWIEIIQLRSYTGSDRDAAMAAFNRLTAPMREKGLRRITMLRSLNLANELSILLGWQGGAPESGKSRLGVQLAVAFSDFGHIYHSGWAQSANLI